MTNPLTNSRLRKILRKTAAPQTGWLDVFPAVIGKAAGTVQTGVPGIIYIRNLLNGQVLTVYNFVTPNTAGLQVDVGRKVETPGLWQVKGVREAYAQPAGGSVGAGSHTHDDLFIDRNRLLPFLVLPIDGSGFTVQVYGDIYRSASGVAVSVANQQLDLESYVPASGAKWIVISADATGEISVNEGAEVESKELLTLADIPDPVDGYIESCAVRLYGGQEQLYRDPGSINDFVDLRGLRTWGASLNLDDLLDVNAYEPNDGDVLTYDTFYDIWVAAAPTVASVNGQTGTVVLDADDIDDTSTTNKFATAAELTQIATNQTDISDHISDPADAHDASAISIADAGDYFTGTDVEGALQELGAKDIWVKKAGDTMTGSLSVTLATATASALTLKSSDDNTTNPIFATKSSGNVNRVTIGATGILSVLGHVNERLELRSDGNTNGYGNTIDFYYGSTTLKHKFRSLIKNSTYVIDLYDVSGRSAWSMIPGSGRMGVNRDLGTYYADDAQLYVFNDNTTRVGFVVQKGYDAQTADQIQVRDSTANVLMNVETDGEITIPQDSKAIKLGAGLDASVYYDGTNLVVNPKVVGTGYLSILGDVSIVDEDIILGTTTGTKIGTATSQKLSLWNATPIIQPTTAHAEASFTENAGGAVVNVDSTFDGYTIQQVVKALRDIGALA